MPIIELGSLQAELGTLGAGSPPNLSGFTLVTIVADFSLGQTAAAGQLTFTLTQGLVNSNTIIPANPLIVTLDQTGALTAQLVATDDPDTAPPGVWYGVTEQIIGAQPRDYFIQIDAANAPQVELASLLPTTLPWC